ncbi:MAG: hypothetical protein FJZ90_01805 [Chloroflexi bacterium]|nr:hypothetical protein [Chloroflexota bacterium]
MHSRILDYVGTAVLALVLSIIMWVNATLQADGPREGFYPEALPIRVVNAPPDMIATNVSDESVRVKIRAFSSRWPDDTQQNNSATLKPSHFLVTADWGDLEPGTNKVPVKVTCSDRTVTILGVVPPTVFVDLEPKRTQLKDVSVELLNREDVPTFYRVYVSSTVPSLVEVEGPASLVEQVDSLRARVNLAGQRTTIEGDFPLTPVDADGREVRGVKLDQATTTVTVAIERRQNFREVTVRARTTGQPARGYYVSGIDIYPATVTIYGPPSVIDTMAGLVDVRGEVDLAGATGRVSEAMELNLPEGVLVQGAEGSRPFTVLVTVSVDAVTGGTTLEVPLSIRRVPERLVATASVPAVDVILTGPSVLLDELQADQVQAYVDLSGLGPGTHQRQVAAEILAPAGSALRGLVIKDIAPKAVEVTLTEQPTPVPTAPPSPGLEPTAPVTPTAEIEVTATLTATEPLTATRPADASDSTRNR